jgi:hypothetical protein
VAGSALRSCLREQIEDRADFIATADYVGPDRRPEDRELTNEELVSLQVPNTLQQKATGEAGGTPIEARIAATLRSLGAQRAWHLARKIGRLADGARKALAAGADFPLLGECVEAMEQTLARIETLDDEFDLSGMREVVASTRAALATLSMAGSHAGARHFELLRVHSDSITLAMEQDESVKSVLVTELARAVAAVRGQQSGADGPDADGDRPGYSWKVRLRAWWDGVDLGEVTAASR